MVDDTRSLLLAAAVISSITYYVIVNAWPLRHIPGPLLARATAFFRLHLALYADSPSRIRYLHKKYGPIVVVGPNHVLVSDPQALQIVYGTSSKFKKVGSYCNSNDFC